MARDAYYTWGNLTSSGGRLGISWRPDPATDDLGGPPASSTESTLTPVTHGLPSAVGEAVTTPPSTDEFVSDPLPVTLHLNASRPVWVNLTMSGYGDNTYAYSYDPCYDYYAKGSSVGTSAKDPDLGVELYANDVLLGGLDHDYYRYYPNGRPADPPGFGVCHYAFPSEASTLPAGAVLKLRVVHHVQSHTFQYGLGPDHRSQIFLPAFSPEEVLFRYPDESNAGAPGSASASPTAGREAATWPLVVGGYGAVVAVAGVTRTPGARRRTTGLVLVLALAAVGLAGCATPFGPGHAQGAPRGDGPKGSATSVLQSGTGLSQVGYGTILGLVHDDLHQPVGGAHVAATGTNNFTDSDRAGRFELKDVPPGSRTLRIEKVGFHVLETVVRVEADRLTRVDATLLPLNVGSVNARPHVHDYWNGATTHLAMDGSLGITSTGNPVSSFTIPTAAPGDASGAPNTVLPGTYSLDVVLTWDATQMGQQRFGLDVEANDHYTIGTWTYAIDRILLPRASGVPFHLASSWELDDVGHQLFSSWVFSIYLPSEDAPAVTKPDYASSAVNREAGTAPAFHVQVLLHKGAIPLEPAHPDHWEGASSLLVTPKLTTAKSPTYWLNSYEWAVEDAFAGGCLTNAYPNQNNWMAYFSADWGAPVKVVPEGTTWLEVKMTQNRASGVGGTGQFAWTVLMHPGNVPPAYFNFQSNANPTFRKAPAGVVSGDGLTTAWRVPIAAEEADGVYNAKSVWDFVVTPDNLQNACLDAHLNFANPLSLTGWSVVAHRDAMPG